MKSLSAVIATLFAALLIFSALPSAFANDMNASLIPERNKAEGSYIGVKNIELRYPAGSSIASQLGEETKRIKFTVGGSANSTDSSIVNAISAFNDAMVASKSPVQVTSMNITYTAVVKPGETSTLISYKIEAHPKMEGFVINQGTESGLTGDIVDFEWRGIYVTQPITLDAPDLGEIEINKAIGLITVLYPEVAEQIESSSAAEIFDEPILDFRKFDQSMETWHFLFDPSGSLAESSAYFREESGAKVVSIYSLGESSFREGTFEAEEKDATANIGGSEVRVHSQVPAPSGQIQIAGFSDNDENAPSDGEFAMVTVDTPEGVQSATGSFPVQVLLIFGGMMGAIAVFILWKARK